MELNMKNFLLLGVALCLAGCQSLAAMAGYVPTEVADGGPPTTILPSGIGLEEAASVSGGISLLTAIGLNLWRNHSRASLITAAMKAGQKASSEV